MYNENGKRGGWKEGNTVLVVVFVLRVVVVVDWCCGDGLVLQRCKKLEILEIYLCYFL